MRMSFGVFLVKAGPGKCKLGPLSPNVITTLGL